jgi:tRNA(Arg) A34 adenosine deaminase TadA
MDRRQFLLKGVAGTAAITVGQAAGGNECSAGEGAFLEQEAGKVQISKSTTYPPRPDSGRLHELWDAKVKELVLLPVPAFEDGQKERHALYCSLLAALVAHYWNGNKRGREGTYPWREKQKLPNGTYKGGDYLGHNIACIAVDGLGEVVDFDFNHNELFNSSVEHAESRLVRRVFSLAQLSDGWATRKSTAPHPPLPYSNVLNDVTIYTSLESCVQCSGIMVLGSVKEVVFLQRDPSQNSIGNILRNLSPADASFAAPLPIPADAFDFEPFTSLDQRYRQFQQKVAETPFYIPSSSAGASKYDHSPSMTSFLCNDDAMDVYNAERDKFGKTLTAQYPTYKPKSPTGQENPKTLTNQDVVDHVQRFFSYAISDGRRGTPHNL